MPFSMIAVILLILAGAGAALLYEVEESRFDRELDLSQLQELQNCAILESSELDQLACDIASEVTQSNGMNNESDLRSRFQIALLDEIRSTYPERHGDFTVRLVRCSLEIRILHLSMNDADVIKKSEMKEQLGTSSVTLPVYVEIAGNYSLTIESQQGSITREFDVQRSIYDPTPFLANRLQIFQSMFEGGKNEIENLVRYQLAALCQDRILGGARSGSLTEIASSASVITDQDVRNALNLAILVEQMKVLRVHDEEFLEATLSQFPCPEEEKIIVDELMHSDVKLDIADLFLLLNNGGHYPLSQILAQSIYSSADAIVLRWLDYLHIIDLVKFIEQMEYGVQITISDLLESITGVDLIEESMVSWMSERFLEAGIHDYNYRWLHYSPSDSYVSISKNTLNFQNQLGDEIEVVIQGNYDIDFPSFDVLLSPVWKDFLIGYKSGTCELADNLELFVKSIAMNVASNANLPEIELELDPKDSLNYLDELTSVVQTAMDPNRDWFEEALSRADETYVIKDPLGQALTEFAHNNWRELFQLNSSVDQAESNLAESIVEEAIAASTYVSDNGMINEIAVVKSAIQNNIDWGVDASIRTIFEGDITPRLMLFDQVFGNLPWEGQSTLLQEVISKLAGEAIDGIPGIKRIVIDQMELQISDLRDQARLRADKILIQLSDIDEFSFVTENGMTICESLGVHLKAPWVSDPNAIMVKISRPEDFDVQVEDYPNHHLTDLLNCSMSPFESGFGYLLTGLMQVELSLVQNPNSLLSRTDARMTITLPFGFQSNFSSSSGWPLQDVVYRPTMTLNKQIAQFLDQLWNALLDTLQLIGDACTQVFNFLKDCLSKLLSYCMEAVQVLSDFLIDLAQGLRDIVQGAVGSLIKSLATTVTATLGQIKCSFSVGGLKMILETCIPDMQFGRSRDLLKWTICIPLVYANLSFGVRIVDMISSGLDIIGFCDMASQDWQAGVLVDPLMLVQDHMIEADGVFPTFSLELKAPEVVQYEKRSFRLSDIPMLGAFLSRIPTPIPGLLASVDAGFEVKYDDPQRDHVVINEIEFNPPGPDSGNEWVELYNPTDEVVDISGWSLETVHGRQMSVILEDHAIAPKSFYVHHFAGQFLDNGGGNKLPTGESVVLSDSTGRRIDTTPFLTDFYNDHRTWQRSLDASERWVFKSASEDRANAFQPFQTGDIELWYNTLYDATIRAFAKMGQDAFDLNNLAALIKNIITETVQIVAEILGRLIVEMSLFIELALQDYSQSFSGGIRLSLVITGEGVRDALLWVSSAVQQALSGITNPTQATMGKRPMDTILDDVYVRFSAYGSASLPRILADALPDARFRLAGFIQVNLASFVPPKTGQQNWSVSFGVLFEEVPGRLLNAFYPVDADKSADCWLFKATIYAGSNNGGTMVG
jgi:hypothetical protein